MIDPDAHDGEPISIRLALSPPEVMKRLEAITDPGAWTSLWPLTEGGRDEKALASVHGNRFRLRMNEHLTQLRRPFGAFKIYYNWWLPVFYGMVEPADEGTAIIGHFGPHPSVRPMTRLWLVSVAVGMPLSVIVAILGPATLPSLLMLSVFLPVGSAAMFLLVRSGQRLALEERSAVIDFMRSLAESREAS